MESILSRCGDSNMAVPSQDQVQSALSSCSGDEEEAVASLITPSFLHNIYAGSSTGDRTLQQKNVWLNQELSTLLKDEALPRDVSCCLLSFMTFLCSGGP